MPTPFQPLGYSQTLVAAKILEVQIAFPSTPQGIFHDKLGIFQDEDGRRVTFVGSANETWAAWGLNHESFEVFCSWNGETELYRTRNHTDYFERLWRHQETGVTVKPLSLVARNELVATAAEDIESAVRGLRRPVPTSSSAKRSHASSSRRLGVLAQEQQQWHRGICHWCGQDSGRGSGLSPNGLLRGDLR